MWLHQPVSELSDTIVYNNIMKLTVTIYRIYVNKYELHKTMTYTYDIRYVTDRYYQ